MSKIPEFKVGDKVQLTAESVDYYENEDGQYHDNGGRYAFFTPLEWHEVYLGGLVVEEVNTDRHEPIYKLAYLDTGLYEFELERD